MEYSLETHDILKSRKIVFPFYLIFNFQMLRNIARLWYFTAPYTFKNDWATDMIVIDKRGFVSFEFKINFNGISYIVSASRAPFY